MTRMRISAGNPFFDLATALAKLAERLPAGQALDLYTRAAGTTVDAMLRADHSSYLGAVAEALVKLTAHLPPEKAADVCFRVASHFLNTRGKPGDILAPIHHAGVVATVATHLTRRQAGQTARAVLDAMRQEQ